MSINLSVPPLITIVPLLVRGTITEVVPVLWVKVPLPVFKKLPDS
jgi:hypothetical protein